jgi:hypothetical protein
MDSAKHSERSHLRKLPVVVRVAVDADLASNVGGASEAPAGMSSRTEGAKR